MYLNIRKIAYFLLWCGLTSAVIVSLLPPHHNPQFGGSMSDKVVHLVSYAILAHVACHAGPNWRRRYILCILVFVVSIIIEFLQPLTGRTFEGMDIVANFGGIIIGILVMKVFFRRGYA
ncbi:MAG: rhomboid family intramembrane serine protease [Rhodobacteraceae bacterium]|nr:rhomboid family intramembrane serine protease [Paracoccaceae bacterium]